MARANAPAVLGDSRAGHDERAPRQQVHPAGPHGRHARERVPRTLFPRLRLGGSDSPYRNSMMTSGARASTVSVLTSSDSRFTSAKTLRPPATSIRSWRNPYPPLTLIVRSDCDFPADDQHDLGPQPSPPTRARTDGQLALERATPVRRASRGTPIAVPSCAHASRQMSASEPCRYTEDRIPARRQLRVQVGLAGIADHQVGLEREDPFDVRIEQRADLRQRSRPRAETCRSCRRRRRAIRRPSRRAPRSPTARATRCAAGGAWARRPRARHASACRPRTHEAALQQHLSQAVRGVPCHSRIVPCPPSRRP